MNYLISIKKRLKIKFSKKMESVFFFFFGRFFWLKKGRKKSRLTCALTGEAVPLLPTPCPK